jgi:hypothetical protein
MNDVAEGSIWEIFFYVKEKIEISSKFQEAFLNDQTREQVNMFDPPPGLSPSDYSALFVSHFMKSRTKSHEELEKSSYRKFRYRTLVQIGNRECVDDIIKTRDSENFDSWENPYIIQSFLDISKEFLNEH